MHAVQIHLMHSGLILIETHSTLVPGILVHNKIMYFLIKCQWMADTHTHNCTTSHLESKCVCDSKIVISVLCDILSHGKAYTSGRRTG